MATAEIVSDNDSFAKKLLYVYEALRGTFEGEYPSYKSTVVVSRTPKKPQVLMTDGEDLYTHIISYPSEIFLIDKDWSKGWSLIVCLAFLDQHDIEVPAKYVPVQLCKEFTRRLFATYRAATIPVSLSQQFEIAYNILKESKSEEPHLLEILHFLHIAMRRLARAHDTVPGGKVSRKTMRDAKTVVEPIKGGTKNDFAGDAYHFWGALLVASMSKVVVQPIDHVVNPLYRVIPQLASFVTKEIVYRIGVNKGINDDGIHPQVDTTGVKLGLLVGNHLSVRQ